MADSTAAAGSTESGSRATAQVSVVLWQQMRSLTGTPAAAINSICQQLMHMLKAQQLLHSVSEQVPRTSTNDLHRMLTCMNLHVSVKHSR